MNPKFTLNDLRQARLTGRKVPVLTCYDYTMAGFMQRAGVPVLLVGDSAANVILGHDSTIPVSLDFMIEIAGAVRRGAPDALIIADMPFGSYQASTEQGSANVFSMIQRSRCDMVKLEVNESQSDLVRRLADAGVAVMAHVGLRPQSVGLLGGYRFQGRTSEEALEIVALALHMEESGAAALLVEATPPQVAKAILDRTSVPVIGCGAGPACHGHVIVTHDAIGWTAAAPKFVPVLGDLATPMIDALKRYVQQVAGGEYPAEKHAYSMKTQESEKFAEALLTPRVLANDR